MYLKLRDVMGNPKLLAISTTYTLMMLSLLKLKPSLENDLQKEVIKVQFNLLSNGKGKGMLDAMWESYEGIISRFPTRDPRG